MIAMAGCTPLAKATNPSAAPSSAEVVDGGELTFATTASPQSWNPLSVAGDATTNRQQQWPLYPHTFLTNVDASVVLNKDLLESAKVVSDDPMTVEYVIRDEAVWSDGKPITGKDFEYTQAVQDPDSCSDCLAAFTQGYSLMDSVGTSSDGKTVTVTFSEPFAQWQALFNYILPAHVAAAYGDLPTSFNIGLSKNIPTVSGGPYLVESYDEGISLTLVKNSKWYGEPAHLDTVRFRYITSTGEQVTALQNGEIDVVYQNPTLDTVEQIRAMTGMTTIMGSTLTYYHLSLKTEGDVMSDGVLRGAITKALDIDDMTKRTVGQYVDDATPMKSAAFVPGQIVQGKEAYRENSEDVGVGTGEVDEALAMLKKAGYTLKDDKLVLPDGTPLRNLNVLTYSVDSIRMELAQLVQAQLAKLGITVVIDPADQSRYGAASREGQFDILTTATALDLGPLSLAQWYQTGAARNSFGYSSKKVDDLIAKASVEIDGAKSVELMNQLDKALLSDGIVVPLFAIPQMAVYSSKFANIFVNPSKYGTTMNIQEWGMVADK
jgi:peptide/nickel transport system substrate-binding protein